MEEDAPNIGFSDPNSKYISAKVVEQEGMLFPLENETENDDNESVHTKWTIHNLWKKNKFNWVNKRITSKIIFGIIVIVILASAFLYLLSKQFHSNFDFVSSDALEVNYNNGKNKTYIYNQKGKILHTIGETVKPLLYTPDMTKIVLRNDRNDSRIYFVNAKNVIKIEGIQSFLNISDNGRYLFYTSTDTKNVHSLKCYDTIMKKEKVVASYQQSDTRREYRYDYVCISPDNKTYSFSKVYIKTLEAYNTNGELDIDIKSYVSINGKKPKFYGNNKLFLKISNKAKYQYYIKLKNNGHLDGFYAKTKNNINKLSGGYSISYFNKDYSEVMYIAENGTYLCIKGKDKYKISDNRVTNVLLPKHGIVNNYFCIKYGIDSFLNKMIRLQEDQSIHLIGKGFQTKQIATTNYNNSLTILSNDGNKLLYRGTTGAIIKISDIKGQRKKETITKEADEVCSSHDLSEVYYINNQQELLFRKNDEKPIKLASGVYNCNINPSGNILFFLKIENSKKTLYYSKNGGKPFPVKNSEAIFELGTLNYGVYFKKNNNGKQDIYINTSGVRFKRILKDVFEVLQTNDNESINTY